MHINCAPTNRSIIYRAKYELVRVEFVTNVICSHFLLHGRFGGQEINNLWYYLDLFLRTQPGISFLYEHQTKVLKRQQFPHQFRHNSNSNVVPKGSTCLGHTATRCLDACDYYHSRGTIFCSSLCWSQTLMNTTDVLPNLEVSKWKTIVLTNSVKTENVHRALNSRLGLSRRQNIIIV